MLSLSTAVVWCCALGQLVDAVPYKSFRAFEPVKRQAVSSSASSDPTQVDLGYAIYQGYSNDTLGLNIWRGIRYAEAPIGNLRWQPPQLPSTNRTQVINATTPPTRCPQAYPGNMYGGPPCPGLKNSTTLPASCANATYFKNSIMGSEDCLFANVFAPQNATNLPVMVWIHGGGYGLGGGAGDGTQDLTNIIRANNHGFVGVTFQYRLGAFGYLSSDEVSRYGTPNAGIYDQHFLLQWVQSYIKQFGGDPTRVTITGESAGAGSVMLQTMAYGGTQGDFLFQNSISASPYLPMQYDYNAWAPTQAYFAFATAVGCFDGTSITTNTSSIFACLQGKDTLSLQLASAMISAAALPGDWGFLPVTDGKLIQQLPSQQLLKQQVNGLRVLSGNNANEGASFVPRIRTQADLLSWIHLTFPLFTEADISKLLLYYPNPTNASVDPTATLYSTNGLTGLTALNQSDLANGPQQIADNIYSETTFVCPSYWLAASQAQRGGDHAGYKYQFSIPPSTHGADVGGYFATPAPAYMGADFGLAFMQMWGNFIMNDNPSVSNLVANGNSTGNSSAGNALANFPEFTFADPMMLNMNTTGGTPTRVNSSSSVSGFYYQLQGPGLEPVFEAVNAYTWEGGRGTRCDFWLSMASLVPE